MLSTIAVGRGILDAPFPQLTDMGRCVESALHYLEAHSPGLTVDKYVLMPNISTSSLCWTQPPAARQGGRAPVTGARKHIWRPDPAAKEEVRL